MKGWWNLSPFIFFFPPFVPFITSLFCIFWGAILKQSFARLISFIQAIVNWYWIFTRHFLTLNKLTAKLLWRGAECWKECLKLLNIAETAENARTSYLGAQDLASSSDGLLIQRRCAFSSVWWFYCTIFLVHFWDFYGIFSSCGIKIIPTSILNK